MQEYGNWIGIKQEVILCLVLVMVLLEMTIVALSDKICYTNTKTKTILKLPMVSITGINNMDSLHVKAF